MKLLALLILLALPGFAALAPAVPPATVETSEEYAAWSAVLNYAYPADASRQLVIENRIPAVHQKPIPDAGRAYQSYSELEIIEEASRSPYTLEKKFTLKLPYVLIAKEDEPGFFLNPAGGGIDKEHGAKLQNAWDHFCKMYPGAYGIVQLSRVGFLNHMSQAAVLVTSREGGSTSVSKLFLLTKKDGAWEVESVVPLMAA